MATFRRSCLAKTGSKLAAIFLLALIAPLSAQTLGIQLCDCFSEDMRIKAAKDALLRAHTAVYVKIIEERGNGTYAAQVLESYKGPVPGSFVVMLNASGKCPGQKAVLDEEALVLAFDGHPTLCDKYVKEYFLVEEFRKITVTK